MDFERDAGYTAEGPHLQADVTVQRPLKYSLSSLYGSADRVLSDSLGSLNNHISLKLNGCCFNVLLHVLARQRFLK